MTDIFISYSRKDLAVAANLAAALDDLGYAVWWDRRNLRGGQAFAREIERVIKRASCVIVIWSHSSAKSEWVYAEASLAQQQGNLLTAAYDEAEIPLPFNTRHNEDLKQWDGDLRHAGLQKLLQSVGRCCSRVTCQKHVVHTQIPEVVLSAPARAGFAWSSMFSLLLGTVSLAVAGSVFYLQADAQSADTLLKTLGSNINAALFSESKSIAITEPTKIAPSKKLMRPAKRTAPPEPEPKLEHYEPLKGGTLMGGGVESVYQQRHVELLDDSKRDSPTVTELQELLPLQPEMVKIPTGSFTPDCAVDVKRADKACDSSGAVIVNEFWMATTEVTIDQFVDFITDTAYKTTAEQQDWCWGNPDSEGEWRRVPQGTWWHADFFQDGSHPVACVSGRDIRIFIQWLNHKTGRRYTLPTETQWAYAARSGLQKKSLHSADNCIYANVADKTASGVYSGWKTHACHDGYVHSAPVGSFIADGHGLHDMYGNVWEWTQSDQQGSDELKMISGGSWGYYNTKVVQSNGKVSWNQDYPSQNIGFRLIEMRN